MGYEPGFQRGGGGGRRRWAGLEVASAGTPPTTAGASSLTGRAAGGSALAVLLALAVMITYLARPFDYFLVGLRIPLAISVAAVLAGVMAGGLKILGSRVGAPLLALVLWMAAITPFSYWKGGSVGFLTRFALVAFSVLLCVGAAPRSFGDIRKMLVVAAVAPTLSLLLASRGQTSVQDEATLDRLSLASGAYANSGDMAMVAGFTLPFWFFVCAQFKWPVWRIPLALIGAILMARMALLSGTRSVLLGGAGMFLVYFFAVRASRRIWLPIAAVVTALIALLFLPGEISARLATVFDAIYSTSGNAGETEADLSTAQRRALLSDSIRYTLTHPITGVGPGQFTDVRWEEGVEEGQPKGYLITHNTYTQASSENGIPGLLLYLSLFAGTIRSLQMVKKLNSPGSHPEWRNVKSMRICISAALVFYSVCAFFLSTLSYPHLFFVGGLSLALERVTAAAVAQAAAARAESAPEPARGVA